MPYISKKMRKELPPYEFVATTPGELNFLVTRLCDDYLRQQGGISYTAVNTVVGALECAKMELYRRVAVPYEDSKIEANGDVYSPETLGQPGLTG